MESAGAHFSASVDSFHIQRLREVPVVAVSEEERCLREAPVVVVSV